MFQAHELISLYVLLLLSARYEKVENELLADSTVAGQDAVMQYLAASAALQQWGQAALAFLLLHTSERPLTADDISAGVESLLEDKFRVSCQLRHSCHACKSLLQLKLTTCRQCQQDCIQGLPSISSINLSEVSYLGHLSPML